MTALDLTYGWHPIALLALGSAAGLPGAPPPARRSQPPAATLAPAVPAPPPPPASDPAPASLPAPSSMPRTLRSGDLLGPVSERMTPSQRARRASHPSLQP